MSVYDYIKQPNRRFLIISGICLIALAILLSVQIPAHLLPQFGWLGSAAFWLAFGLVMLWLLKEQGVFS